MSWPLPQEEPLELDEIQGHVLVGFGGAPQALAAYTARDAAGAARTAARWAGRVTTARQLYRDRKGRSARDVVEGSGPWMTIALSHRVLAAAGRPFELDEWFEKSGMAAVAATLNDPRPPAGGRHGTDWVVGAPGRPVDVLVVVAAGRVEAAEEIVGWFSDDAREWMDGEPFVERLLPMKGAKEHFGFRDGISQPAVLGTVDGEMFDADRPPDDGVRMVTNRAQALVWPGEFVFGYRGLDPAEHPRAAGPPAVPRDAGAAEFARNGSLLVYRRLLQDARGFRDFCERKAADCESEISGLDAERLAELIVGRRRDGLPLAAPPDADTKDPVVMNGFDFNGDAMTKACPVAAHIRKVNPRDGTKDQPLRRILRRGAPFGERFDEGEAGPPPGGRGLAFLAYQTDIQRQFGVLMANWANHPSSPGGGGGHDVLIGQVPDGTTRHIYLDGDRGPVKVRAETASWVRMTGGAFLFTPSLSALRSLAETR